MRVNTYGMELNNDRLPILVKESSRNYCSLDSVLSPSDVFLFLNDNFHANRQAEEHVWIIGYRTDRVIGVFEISHGLINSSMVEPREVFSRLLMLGVTRFIIAHNHTSGLTNPSNDDILITRRLKQTGDLMGIGLMDHLILGEKTYFSFQENEML